MKKYTNGRTIAFQIILAIEAAFLAFTLSSYKIIYKFLIQYLFYDIYILLLILSVFLLVFSFTYLFFTKNLFFNSVEIIKKAEIVIMSRHIDFRKNILSKKFDNFYSEYSLLCHAYPSGVLSSGIHKLWIEDIEQLYLIIDNYLIESDILNICSKKLQNDIFVLVKNIFNFNKLDIEEKFYGFIEDTFRNLPQEHLFQIKDSFSSEASIVTNRKISYFSALINNEKCS